MMQRDKLIARNPVTTCIENGLELLRTFWINLLRRLTEKEWRTNLLIALRSVQRLLSRISINCISRQGDSRVTINNRNASAFLWNQARYFSRRIRAFRWEFIPWRRWYYPTRNRCWRQLRSCGWCGWFSHMWKHLNSPFLTFSTRWTRSVTEWEVEDARPRWVPLVQKSTKWLTRNSRFFLRKYVTKRPKSAEIFTV